MGHYLSEVEDDGVPRSMKAAQGRPNTDAENDAFRERAYRKHAHRKMLRARTGVEPSNDLIAALGVALDARRPQIRAVNEAAAQRVREITSEALDEVLGA